METQHGQKLLEEMGWDYQTTESAARRVAEFAEKKIEQFAQSILDNYTLALWSSRYGLTPVEMSAKELVDEISNEDK